MTKKPQAYPLRYVEDFFGRLQRCCRQTIEMRKRKSFFTTLLDDVGLPDLRARCNQSIRFMSDRDKKQASNLDIGLSEILARVDNNVGNAPIEHKQGRPPTEILSLDSLDGSLEGEFVGLAAEKKWGVLVSRAENSFDQGDDAEARLWWIRGHLGAFSLPVSLLAAPFESLCRQFQGQSTLHVYRNLIVEIAEIMLGRLKEVGDRRQEYSLRVALHQLGLAEFSSDTEKARKLKPTRAHEFTLGEPAAAEERSSATVSERTVRGSKLPVLGIVVLVLLTGGAYLLQQFFKTVPVDLASEDFVVEGQVPTLMRPVVRARDTVGSLGALVYSLQNKDTTSSLPTKGLDDPKGAEESNSKKEVLKTDQGSTGDGREAQPPRATPHEVVKTDGPVEGPEFRRGVERNEGKESARLPEVIPEFQVSPVPGASYPDGSAVLPGVVKSVITRTEVFSSAGYGARVVGRLEAGDKVSVEGQAGRWLRIRSRQGRAGFVYAQDIGELEDFSVPGHPDRR